MITTRFFFSSRSLPHVLSGDSKVSDCSPASALLCGDGGRGRIVERHGGVPRVTGRERPRAALQAEQGRLEAAAVGGGVARAVALPGGEVGGDGDARDHGDGACNGGGGGGSGRRSGLGLIAVAPVLDDDVPVRPLVVPHVLVAADVDGDERCAVGGLPSSPATARATDAADC